MGGKFKPGQSGNPGGRPADSPEVAKAKELLRKLCPKAAEVVERCLKSKKFGEQRWAAETILGYGIGKPAQAVEFSDKGNEQLAAILEIVRKDPK